VPRQRDIPDHADEKWDYTEHTRAKHEILHRYLGAWLAILGQGRAGKRWNKLILVDGFAGRGRYNGGQSGSPKIMFDRAVQVVEDGFAKSVLIRGAEPNDVNFGQLAEVCSELRHSCVRIEPTQETFVSLGTKVAEWAEQHLPAPPIFVMVDPYGVRGVPLDLIARLLKVDRLEVLLTFMVRDPSRFLIEENFEEPMTELYGGDTWRQCIDAPNRPECLMLRFQEVVLDGVAKYALPFRVYEDERKTILYFLVHLTNSGLGTRKMKETMVKKSGDMTFWPVTMKNPDQLELEVAEGRPWPTLQRKLREKYAGRSMTFEELLNDDYPSGDAWIETHYRWAVRGLAEADEPQAVITRVTPVTPSGRPAVSLTLPDTVTFS
jgi:three-Cys-motif partner protein